MQELDATPFLELERAIVYLASGKSPGKDGDQPEVVKAAKDQEMRDANMITLCKNKGYVQGTVQYDGSSLDPFPI